VAVFKRLDERQSERRGRRANSAWPMHQQTLALLRPLLRRLIVSFRRHRLNRKRTRLLIEIEWQNYLANKRERFGEKESRRDWKGTRLKMRTTWLVGRSHEDQLSG
jgi:hypothetical protein